MKARKTFGKFLSVFTAVVISVCTMVCSASAAESNKYVEPGTAKPNYTIGTENGSEIVKGTYDLYKTPNGPPSSGAYSERAANNVTISGFGSSKSVFEINCTYFKETTPSTAQHKPDVRYWSYVTKTSEDKIPDIIPGGFSARYFNDVHSEYVRISLLDTLYPQNSLQLKIQLENYSNSSLVVIDGNYKLF